MKNSGIEWIGNIPDDTKVARLKYFVDVINGFAFQSDKFSDYGEINVVRISDIKQNYDFSKCVKYENFEGQENYMIKKDDILMAMSGGTYGKSLHLKNDIIEKNAINQRVCIIRGEQNIFNKYLFQTSAFFDYLAWRFMGAAQPNISAIDIGNFPIVLFEKSKAYIVANYLDGKCGKIDELIANQQGQIEKLKEYKQSVITEAVTKGLDKSAPMKDSNLSWIIGKVPAHWAVVNPKALFSLRRERAKEGERQLTASQQYGVIYQDDYMRLTGSRIVVVMKDFDILKHVEKGDFVISMRSFQGGLEYSENDGSISSAYVMLKPNRKYVVDHFYKWLFKSSLYINALQSTSDLIRDGQAMRYSNFTQLWLYQIPLKEQEQIASYLDKKCADIDKLIAIKQEKIEKLQEYKKSLIYEYVTGKKEVV